MWINLHKLSRLSTLQWAINEKLNRTNHRSLETTFYWLIFQNVRHQSQRRNNNISVYIKPISIQSKLGKSDGKCQQVKEIKTAELSKMLTKFSQDITIRSICEGKCLDARILLESFGSFRKFCMDSNNLSAELCTVIIAVQNGSRDVSALIPSFLDHVHQIYPHLAYEQDLQNISNMTMPAKWYPDARKSNRKIIFHAGPTNSGKTYNALKRFLEAKSGVYCGPLKMLASEIFSKSNEMGTPCDLVTGEERRFGQPDRSPSAHVACTVEMVSLTKPYDVAIIDEIQLLKDPLRGWAFSRAFLGTIANEVHVCGEFGSLELLKQLCISTNETLEVHQYERLTQLTIEEKAICSLDKIQAGDCIVCFNINDIFKVSRDLESKGEKIAVIYGALPPSTKLKQAARFNDPNDSCNILVATDAIGMGINLSIRRIVFYSITRPQINELGEKEINTITASSALQIAGRAGRFGTQWENGYVTAYHTTDLESIKHKLSSKPEPIMKAGLHPTEEQIELYAYYLPNLTLSNLMNVFQSLCTFDDSIYFMCSMDNFKFLADIIECVPLPIRVRYTFCCSPIDKRVTFVCSMFLKFARKYSKNDAVTFQWLSKECNWPCQVPKTIFDLAHLLSVFDVMDNYLWLSYRYPEMFPQGHVVREAQHELDVIIQEGLLNITNLLKNADSKLDTSESQSKLLISKPTVTKEQQCVPKSEEKKLADQLLEQGLISEEQLEKLRKEWLSRELLRAKPWKKY